MKRSKLADSQIVDALKRVDADLSPRNSAWPWLLNTVDI